MKNLKSKRIVLIALSLMLLIGSVIGITVSAADDDTYEIKSINIAYGDKAYVLMAVDASVDDAAAGKVEVKYSIGENNYTAAYWPELTADTEKNPSGLPVFYTIGIAPKDIGEDIIAEAHVKGATSYTPVYENVSLAEYLYHMLYAKGRINATEENELHAKSVYETLLAYGAAAQQYFWNDKAENAENQRELVTNRSYVYADGATINATGENELLLPGKTGTVTLVPTTAASTWSVTTYDENGDATTAYVTGTEISITGHTVIANATSRGYGQYANDENYASMVETYENFTITSNSYITATHWGWATRWNKISSDVEGKYFDIGRIECTDTFSDGHTVFTVNKTEDVEGKVYKTVFETDVHWGEHNDALNGKTLGYIKFFVDGNYTKAVNLNVDSEGNLYFATATGYAIAVGEWANIRMEIASNVFSLYINDKLAYTMDGASLMDLGSVNFEFRAPSSINSEAPAEAAKFSLLLDNTFCARIEEKIILTRGFGKYANDENYASMVETYENFTNTSNPNIIPVHWGHAQRWNKLLSDNQGKYFNIGRDADANFTDGKTTLNADKTENVEGKAYKAVFETDVHWGAHNDALNGKTLGYLKFNAGSSYLAALNLIVDSEGNLTFTNGQNKSAAIEVGEWVNIRVEFYDDLMYLYLNDDLAFSVSTGTATEIDIAQVEIRATTSIDADNPADVAVFSLSLDNTFFARIENK